MKHYNQNGINILLEKTPKTPRMSVSFFFKTDKKEKFYGINSLLARLLLQGTKTYSASELALAFENECIDITTKAKNQQQTNIYMSPIGKGSTLWWVKI